MASWWSRSLRIKTAGRGHCQLCTSDITSQLPELRQIKSGLLCVFVPNPEASVTINENADPSVRVDMDGAAERFGRSHKEDPNGFLGSVFGHSLVVPVRDGRVQFGTWQGFYLCSWGGQSTLDIHVTMVNGAESMETTTFSAKSRGLHSALSTLCKKLPERKTHQPGICNFLIKHTSASLCNGPMEDKLFADEMETTLNRVVPNKWNREFFTHTYEGDDDMPGHVKSSLVGASITLPWHVVPPTHDLYVCEHRDVGGWGGGHERKITATVLKRDAVCTRQLSFAGTATAENISRKLVDSLPEISAVNIGLLHICANKVGVALVLAGSDVDGTELAEAYQNLIGEDDPIRAAIAASTLILPIHSGAIVAEDLLKVFAMSSTPEIHIYATVFGCS